MQEPHNYNLPKLPRRCWSNTMFLQVFSFFPLKSDWFDWLTSWQSHCAPRLQSRPGNNQSIFGRKSSRVSFCPARWPHASSRGTFAGVGHRGGGRGAPLFGPKMLTSFLRMCVCCGDSSRTILGISRGYFKTPATLASLRCNARSPWLVSLIISTGLPDHAKDLDI